MIKILENCIRIVAAGAKTSTQQYTHLTHFSPVSHFYTPWKRQKTFGIEMGHWTKMG